MSHAPALEPVVPARPTIVAAAKVRETPQGRTIRIAIDRIEVGPPRAPLPAPLARRAKPSMTLSRYEAGQR
ncbi:MAG TPA: hypothetical protein VMA36_06040 [Candidatus Limnocylindria bacterium]|nr:hypothetical protein [Candidatus Limnocylindria bacterium]